MLTHMYKAICEIRRFVLFTRILIAFIIFGSCWNILLLAPKWGEAAANFAIPNLVLLWPTIIMAVCVIFERLPAYSSFRVALVAALALTTLMSLIPVYLQYEAWRESLSLVLNERDGFRPDWFRWALFYYSGLGAAFLLFRIDKAMGKS